MFKLLTCFALSISIAVAPLCASASVIDLPRLGDPADNALSPAQERLLGKEVVAELYANDYIVEDPELENYINTIGYQLVSHSATAPLWPMHFFVVADDRINAFALPGGFIGINIGTLLAAANESELAGVMGHELAHVTQRHIARGEEDTKVADALTWAAVLAAILAGSVANPNMVIGAIGAGQAVNYQRNLNYTRAHEKEADRIGIQTMAAAGFDPNGMADFFIHLEQQTRLYGGSVPEILLTHPLNTSRIAAARARIAELPKITHKDSMDFSLLQARARVMAADRESQATDYYGSELSSGNDTPAVRYGYAYALLQLGRIDEAQKILQPTFDQYPHQALIGLLHAHLQLAAHQTSQSLDSYAQVLKLFPRYAPAVLDYADALITAGRPDQARQLLLSSQTIVGSRMEASKLLAEAAREMGNNPESAYQMANYLYLRGDYGNALAQLDAGLRLSGLGSQDKARLIARRQEIRAKLPANWRAPEASGQLAENPGIADGLRLSAP